MTDLSSIDDLRSALRETPVPPMPGPDTGRIKTAARRRRRRTIVAISAPVAVASVGLAVWLPGVLAADGGVTPTGSVFTVAPLAPFGCSAGENLEVTDSPLTDGSPPAAIEPLQRIDMLLKTGFLYYPEGPIIVDDSGLAAEPAYVLVGSAADGTVARVEFVLADNGNWAFNGLSQCS